MTASRSQGICSLCRKQCGKAAMIRHLKSCAPRHDLPVGEPETLYHLRVASGIPLYWLDLEAEESATLFDLDQFLREIWLECCGHMSAFHLAGVEYLVYVGEPFGHLHEQHDMEVELAEVLTPGLEFEYTYDFGTSTRLRLRAVGTRRGVAESPLTLLARNEPPVWPCGLCGRPATGLCSLCLAEGTTAFWCAEHCREHACSAGALLAVTNSPRMGVCAYGA